MTRPRNSVGGGIKATGPTLGFSGTLNPDATGSFLGEGIYNGQPYFHNTVKGFYLWYDTPGMVWVVSILLGTYGAGWWESVNMISAAYTHQGTATGDGNMYLP